MFLTAFLRYSNERFRHNHAVRRRRTDNRNVTSCAPDCNCWKTVRC